MGAHHAAHASLVCAVLTVSDTRTPDTDSSGARIRELLEADGHRVAAYAILPDEPEIVRTRLVELVAESVEVAIINGGTGLAPRDTTYEAVVGMLDKRLDGFGELFRSLSFAEIGPAAMLSRAVAGVAGRTARRVAAGQHARGRSGDAEAAAPRARARGAAPARLRPCACGSGSSPRCGSDSVRARSVRCAREPPPARCGTRWCAHNRRIGAVGIRIAVNERYVEPDHELADGDEVAFFPPVSGG